ncbi:MAG: glutamine--fructose-6-phosphate transaminase (isomerizing) [Gemmatimonadetes bacterium]|nr:glutamine--fructose-6-phosphate transaminase (isomerizing) [Gemmatimonadota bacterium]
MCGIVAYAGAEQASPILFEALSRLEYRGYDSAGLAVQNGVGLETRRAAGRLEALGDLLDKQPLVGESGIAHTRWATHGEPTAGNAHPHMDCSGEIAVCHNGIIENADVLRAELIRRGHEFQSDTDTEVLAHLVEEHWLPPLHLSVARALSMVEGTFGIAVMSSREPGRIVCARRGSPLVIGLGSGRVFAASDAAALLPYTRRVVYLDDGEIAVIDSSGCDILSMDAMSRIVKPVEVLDWDLEAAERGGHAHFMLKEIFEQPKSLEATLRGRIQRSSPAVKLGGLSDVAAVLSDARRIVFTACGTSWHAGLVGKFMVEEYARVQADVEYASEWRYRNPVLEPGTVVVGVSQSGETADTLAALSLAREKGATTLGVVNVVGSSIARATNAGIYLHAGPEIGVASTKAFTSQVAAMALFALYLGRQRGLDPEVTRRVLTEIQKVPDKVRAILSRADELEEMAQRLVERGHNNFLYLGRGYSFPVSLEGALKLKEISYIHAEGFSAAEMKHGPIALIDEDMPVVVVAPRDSVYPKVLSNMREVKARGGYVVAVTTEPNGLGDVADEVFTVPSTEDSLQPILSSIPLQLLAYHIGVMRGCDVDKPRNLAKSVTVE